MVGIGNLSHVCNNQQLFTELDNTKQSTMMVTNGKTLKSLGSETLKIKRVWWVRKKYNTEKYSVVPDIKTSLMSVRKAAENGCLLKFQNNKSKLLFNGITYLNGIVNNDCMK